MQYHVSVMADLVAEHCQP